MHRNLISLSLFPDYSELSEMPNNTSYPRTRLGSLDTQRNERKTDEKYLHDKSLANSEFWLIIIFYFNFNLQR